MPTEKGRQFRASTRGTAAQQGQGRGAWLFTVIIISFIRVVKATTRLDYTPQHRHRTEDCIALCCGQDQKGCSAGGNPGEHCQPTTHYPSTTPHCLSSVTAQCTATATSELCVLWEQKIAWNKKNSNEIWFAAMENVSPVHWVYQGEVSTWMKGCDIKNGRVSHKAANDYDKLKYNSSTTSKWRGRNFSQLDTSAHSNMLPCSTLQYLVSL